MFLNIDDISSSNVPDTISSLLTSPLIISSLLTSAAGILAAVKATGTRLQDHTFLFQVSTLLAPHLR
jgi:hypothetical protein